MGVKIEGAMKCVAAACLTLFFIYKPTQGTVQHEHGTFFQQVRNDEGENSRTDVSASKSIIHDSFHRCDLDAACYYVVEEVKRNKYSMLADGKDLPATGKDMRTWEKVKVQPAEFMAVACEHTTLLKIECQMGSTIHVTHAMFGRLSTSICPGNIYTTNCAATTSMSKVKEMCDEKQACSVKSSIRVFGDPCPGTNKYLEVKYHCSRQ
eukprot:Seg166.7 transcript_id=Seg166.7/GoldUCD/mRNA.D3Y31 product="Latrophilin Cirl" protein_id=Seg166.7/GoldUCD/D3Y31